MATKPTQSITWATEFNYLTGAFIGYPTKLLDPLGATEGSIPGEGIVAQYYNANMNILGQHSQWIIGGSSAAGLDAHIMETNADGTNATAALVLGGTASTDEALVITENSGAAATALRVENTSTGNAIIGIGNSNVTPAVDLTQNGTSSVLRASHVGTGIGVLGISLGGTAVQAQTTGSGNAIQSFAVNGAAFSGVVTGTGEGIDVVTDSGVGLSVNTASGNAIELIHTNGRGIQINGSGTGESLVMSQTGNGGGIEFTSLGSGVGIDLDMGTGNGINITGSSAFGMVISTTTGPALFCSNNTTLSTATFVNSNVAGSSLIVQNNNAGALSSTSILSISGVGDAVGVNISAGDGYALIAESAAVLPQRAALRLVPQGDEPSLLADGDIWYDSTANHLGIGQQSVGQYLWSTPGGFCEGFSRTSTLDTNNTNNYANGQWFSCSLFGNTAPQITGYVEIEVGFLMEQNGGVANDFDWRIFDVTAGVIVFEWLAYKTNIGSWLTVNQRVRYFVPATGNRTFRLEFKNPSASGTISVDEGYISVTGVYPTA